MVATDQEKLHYLTRGVVHFLGDGWKHNHDHPNSYVALVTHNDGRAFGLRILPRGRVEVFPSYPEGARYESFPRAEKITVGLDVAPERAARDIARRFLPGYTTTLRQVQEQITRSTTAAQRRDEAGRHLAELIGGTYDDRGPGSFTGEVRWCNDQTYGNFRITFGGTEANAEIHGVPVDKLAAIITILKGEDHGTVQW